ncbi:MAG: hypothetical protein ACTHKU_03170 [Verrucomicrobiota bacterium]
MKRLLSFIGLIVCVVGCNRDAKIERAVVGVWRQGLHTLSLAEDGRYVSDFPAPVSQVYSGRWHVDDGLLVVTDLTSNGVPVADDRTKVLEYGSRLVLGVGTNFAALER